MHAYLCQPTRHLPVANPAFGNWIHRRRLEVGLRRVRAAALAGLTHRDWIMLEQGWSRVTTSGCCVPWPALWK
jgi:hypothetical protein